MTKVKKAKTKFPNMENATAGFCADELGAWRAKKAIAEEMEKFFRAGLMARLDEGQDRVEGEKYIATVEGASREGLNTKKIREDMDEDWIDEHTSVTSYKVVRTKLVED